MNKLIYNIIKGALGILLVVLAMGSAMAQKPVPYFEVNQCDTLDIGVVKWPGDRYTWDIYTDSTVNYATESGDIGPVPYFVNDMYQGSSVQIVGLGIGSYFLRVMVWDEETCTNNLMVFRFNVLENLPTATLEGDSVCIDDPVYVKVRFTGTGPWEFVYTYGDGENFVNAISEHSDEPEIMIPIQEALPVGPHVFWVMEVTDQCTVNSYPVEEDRPRTGILIYPKPKVNKIYQQDN